MTDFEFNNNKGTGNGQKCNRSSALIGDNQIIDKVPDKLSHCLFLSDLNSFENTVAGIYNCPQTTIKLFQKDNTLTRDKHLIKELNYPFKCAFSMRSIKAGTTDRHLDSVT